MSASLAVVLIVVFILLAMKMRVRIFVTFTTLGKFSWWQIDDSFLVFPRKQDFTFHADWSKGQILVSWEK